MRISRDSTLSTAPRVCAALVTSRVRGVTRPSKWVKGWRVPAYTRFAPLLKASSTSACPIPRLAPVTRTALSAIVMVVLSLMLICLLPCLVCAREAYRPPETKTFGAAEKSHRLRVHVRFGSWSVKNAAAGALTNRSRSGFQPCRHRRHEGLDAHDVRSIRVRSVRTPTADVAPGA